LFPADAFTKKKSYLVGGREKTNGGRGEKEVTKVKP